MFFFWLVLGFGAFLVFALCAQKHSAAFTDRQKKWIKVECASALLFFLFFALAPLINFEADGALLIMGVLAVAGLICLHLFGAADALARPTLDETPRDPAKEKKEDLPTFKEYKVWQTERPDLKTWREYKEWKSSTEEEKINGNGGDA